MSFRVVWGPVAVPEEVILRSGHVTAFVNMLTKADWNVILQPLFVLFYSAGYWERNTETSCEVVDGKDSCRRSFVP